MFGLVVWLFVYLVDFLMAKRSPRPPKKPIGLGCVGLGWVGLVCWLGGWVGWLAVWLAGWLIGWFGWLGRLVGLVWLVWLGCLFGWLV